MKRFLPVIISIIGFLGLSVGMTSCGPDSWYYDDSWYDDDYYGDSYDPALSGYWQLVQVDGQSVGGMDRNFLYFNGYGRGRYYFFENGRRYVEDTYYNCQWSNTGVSDFQVNLQYGNGYPVTMNYWFTNRGRTLWLNWRDNGRPVTYVYDLYGGAPW
ncbi:MAG: hypothetical protein K2J03_04355 [Muribaculaceae bacterium]|nr:hypothetical protein [Muribaculaceae bacterium]